jgi:hypothetical protein
MLSVRLTPLCTHNGMLSVQLAPLRMRNGMFFRSARRRLQPNTVQLNYLA